MGTPRAPWQNIVCLCPQTTGIATAAAFTSGLFMIETGKPGLPVLNRDFSINPGQRFVEERQAFGLSNIMKEERKLENEFPTCTLEAPLNAFNFSLIAWSFFQKGISEATGTPYVKTAIAYTDPACEMWLTIADPITGALATGNNEAMHGANCKSFTISGQEGGQAKISAEFIGGNFANNFNAASAVITVSEQAGLLYRNMVMKLDTNQIYVPSFSITFNNNAETLAYNSTAARKHILGDLEITGEISVPRDSGNATEDDDAQIIDLLAGDDKRLQIYWGAVPAVANAQIAIDLGILYKEKEKTNEVEVGSRLPFEYVGDNNALSVTMADTIDRTIP